MKMNDPVLFRYLRLKSDVGDAVISNAATCAFVHAKWLAVGMIDGEMVLSDHLGRIKKRWRAHGTAVSKISSDIAGEYVGSCASDGHVVIRRVYEIGESQQPVDDIESHPFSQPLRSFHLDPNFGKHNVKRFVVGGLSQLIISKRAWYSQKDLVLHEGEGEITNMSWFGSLLAWINDRGVKILDVDTDERIAFIERPGGSTGGELLWESASSLVIGWSNAVQFLETCDPKNESRKSSIVNAWEIERESTLAGITIFDEHSMALLCYSKEMDEQGTDSYLPEIQLRSRNSGEMLLTPDGLELRGGKELVVASCSLKSTRPQRTNQDLYLQTHPAVDAAIRNGLPQLFIISPHDIILARVRDLDDHVASALQEHRFSDALEIAKKHPKGLRRYRVPDLVQQYLEDLLFHGEYDTAAAACVELFSNDSASWEFWILRFLKYEQLRSLAPFIPLVCPRLEGSVYELVLDHFLANDSTAFLETVKKWGFPGRGENSLYSLSSVLARTETHVANIGPDALLIEALAVMHTMFREYDLALSCYLNAESLTEPINVFELIEEHGLYANIRDRVPSLIRLSREMAGELLVKATDEISVESVVNQLGGSPEHTLWYLHTLFSKRLDLYNEPHFGNLHLRHVHLYVEFGDSELIHQTFPDGDTETPIISFLKWSTHAQNNPDFLPACLDLCKKHKPPLWDEMVYIYGTTQQSQEGLRILLTEVGDVRRAINFVEGEKDSATIKELWDDLIRFSLANQYFLTGMLDYAGLYSVELPSRLISEIPPRMEIDDLRRKIMFIIDDYRFQVSLQQGLCGIVETWYHKEKAKMYRTQRKGRRVASARIVEGSCLMLDASED